MSDLPQTIAALERAADAQSATANICVEDHQSGHAAMLDADVALLRALAAALKDGQEAWQWADGDTIDIAPHSNRPHRGDSHEDKWRAILILTIPTAEHKEGE
jgi:hypothetical protein